MGTDEESARGLTRLEGHLLWAAEVEDARRQADRFTGHLPWLTTAQREDVERVHIAERLAASRMSLMRIRGRAAELRAEYERRYRQLRARCVAAAVVGVTGAAYTAILVILTRK